VSHASTPRQRHRAWGQLSRVSFLRPKPPRSSLPCSCFPNVRVAQTLLLPATLRRPEVSLLLSPGDASAQTVRRGSMAPLNSPTQSLSKQLALPGSNKTAWLSAFLSKPLTLTLPDKLFCSFPREGGSDAHPVRKTSLPSPLTAPCMREGRFSPGTVVLAPEHPGRAQRVVHAEVYQAWMEGLPCEANGV